MAMIGKEFVDDVRKWGRSPEIRGMELPGVVKTGLLMIISGIVVGGGMSILWSRCWLLDPFEDFSAKVIGSNVACLSILFASALMTWWAAMNLLVPYRRERWLSWKKWKEKLSEEERLLLSELFKPRYSEYMKEQGGKRLTPTKQERQIPKKLPDMLMTFIAIDEILSPQELTEWMRENWGQDKNKFFTDWKESLHAAKKRGEDGEAVKLGLDLCEMLDGDLPEEKVLLNLIEENFAIVKKDKNDYPHAPNLKHSLAAMFDKDGEEKRWPEFFFEKRRRNLGRCDFMNVLRSFTTKHTEGGDKEVVEEIYEITLPAWRLLEHLERRGSLP